LGIEFDKSGNWLNALQKNVGKCKKSMGHLYSLTDNPDQGLNVGQLAELWGLFARPCLLYGSEIWSTLSDSALETMEVTQTMAGRQMLGKSGDSNIIRAAVYGDLGWMSVKSHLRLAKLRFFGRLLRLPGNRLVKRVFLLSSSNFSKSLATLPLADVPTSWCKEMFQILIDLGLKTWWTQPLPDSLLLSANAFKREAKKYVHRLDAAEWKLDIDEPPVPQTGLSAKEHYHRIKIQKGPERFLVEGDRKSALFEFYLRARNFGLNARTQHGLPGPPALARKSCLLCNLNCIEDEEHFILTCSAYAFSRHFMWSNIEGNLIQHAAARVELT
jgi:hypothetical protein